MSSSWLAEVGAVFRKEVATEIRSKTGIVTTGLFSAVTVVAVSIASFNARLSEDLAAGLMLVVLIFAAVIAMPRTFLVEEEQGTGDLLRLLARPHAVYWGKVLYNLLFMGIIGLVLGTLFLAVTHVQVAHPLLYVICLSFACASFAGAVTLCGALVAQASNRAALAGAIAMPLLLPLIFLGVSGLRVAFGFGLMENGVRAAFGLACYSLAVLVPGPYLYAAVWKS